MNVFWFVCAFVVIAITGDGSNVDAESSENNGTTTLSYAELISALKAKEQALNASEQALNLMDRAIKINFCMSQVRNGVKLIQIKYMSPGYIAKFRDLKKLRNEDVLKKIESLKPGVGMQLRNAHVFMVKLVKTLTDCQLGKLWCDILLWLDSDDRLCHKPFDYVGRFLKKKHTETLIENWFYNLKPKILGYIMTQVDETSLGRVLASLNNYALWDVLQNCELPFGSTWQEVLMARIAIVDEKYTDEIFSKIVMTQKEDVRLLIKWLCLSKEPESISDPELNGRLSFFAQKLREEFPGLKTVDEMNAVADSIFRAYGICSPGVKKLQLRHNDRENIQKYINSTETLFDDDEEAKTCCDLLCLIFSGNYYFTRREAEMFQIAGWW